jgi:hypothetical protein
MLLPAWTFGYKIHKIRYTCNTCYRKGKRRSLLKKSGIITNLYERDVESDSYEVHCVLQQVQSPMLTETVKSMFIHITRKLTNND